MLIVIVGSRCFMSALCKRPLLIFKLHFIWNCGLSMLFLISIPSASSIAYCFYMIAQPDTPPTTTNS